MRGIVGWKEAQLTPLSWPSKTCLIWAPVDEKRSSAWGDPPGWVREPVFEDSPGPPETFLARRFVMSQTRTVWSNEAETTMSLKNIFNNFMYCENEIFTFCWVKLCAHNIMVMSSKNWYTTSTLPIPNSDSLIIRARKNPRMLLMKAYCSNIVQMTQ